MPDEGLRHPRPNDVAHVLGATIRFAYLAADDEEPTSVAGLSAYLLESVHGALVFQCGRSRAAKANGLV
jgi:hypothetical protein